MLLLLHEAIKKAGGDDTQFFTSAYIWRFDKRVDVSGDILAFRVQQFIPPYVCAYLRHIYGN